MPAPIHLADIIEPRRNNFNFIRLAAALAVVASHATLLHSGDPARELMAGLSCYNLGQHAVNIFFVLSGIMVTASLLRSASLLDFLVARSLRIYPALICVALLLLLVLGPMVTNVGFADYIGDRRTLLFLLKVTILPSGHAELPGVFSGNPVPGLVNVPIWTIKYELICYVLLAGIFLLRALTAPAQLVCALFLLGALTMALFVAEGSGHIANAADHIARFWLCFSFGVALYLLRTRVPIRASVVVALALAWWISLDTPLERSIAPLATGYGAVSLAALPIGPLRDLTNRIDLSYGVYIFGWPVSQTLLWWHPQIGLTALQLASIALLLPLSTLSWLLIEKPSLAHRRLAVGKILQVARWSGTRAGVAEATNQRTG